MTLSFRIVLIAAALVVLVLVTGKVRNSKMKLEDSISWFCASVLLLVLSVFPQLFVWLSGLVGTYSPANFVFLVFIAILLWISFKQSVRISQNETKIKELTQLLAIEKFERHQNDKADRDFSEATSSRNMGDIE